MKTSLGAMTMPLPAPVWVVGSYDAAGRPNAMTASWTGICCSDPPCVAVSLRKATYSYGNLVARRAFTISVPSARHLKAVDYLGLASGRDEDKLARAGLTALRSALVDVPYVDDFPVVMECRVLHTLEIGLHTQFIGEVLDVKVDEDVLKANGRPDIDALGLVVFTGRYHGVGPLLERAFAIGKEI